MRREEKREGEREERTGHSPQKENNIPRKKRGEEKRGACRSASPEERSLSVRISQRRREEARAKLSLLVYR